MIEDDIIFDVLVHCLMLQGGGNGRHGNLINKHGIEHNKHVGNKGI